MTEERWFSEKIIPGVRVAYEAQEVLELQTTAHQQLSVFENCPFGRVLMLDHAVQVAQADEFIYHEMMSHVPLLAHGHAVDVLIIGGGDCGLAEEVLKHSGVRRLVQVEIDAAVVQLARRHFAPMNAPVFKDERFHLVIADGADFVARTDRRFDVVLVDSTDPIGPGKVLFSESFYRNVRGCLNPGGVVVTQGGVPFLQAAEFATGMRSLAAAFPIVACYLIAVPSYFGGHLALGWASSEMAPDDISVQTLAGRYEAARLATRYYTPQVHQAAFVLPRYIADSLTKALSLA